MSSPLHLIVEWLREVVADVARSQYGHSPRIFLHPHQYSLHRDFHARSGWPREFTTPHVTTLSDGHRGHHGYTTALRWDYGCEDCTQYCGF